MARLHEHQGKKLLSQRGLAIPKGRAVSTAAEACDAAKEIGARCVLKIQAWTTGRAAIGGVAFADTPEQAQQEAERLLQMKVGAFPVEEVLVEEAIPIKDEIFVSLSIDDAARAPMLLVSFTGGSGIEDRAEAVHRLPIDVTTGVDQAALAEHLKASPIDPSLHKQVAEAINQIVTTAKEVEARSLEVNPLVTTIDGRVLAADCRVTIDDYAVFRHPELEIGIARELDHPPTQLERIAYEIENEDHRGTFYFAMLPVDDAARNRMIGFHGAGGGGSMMSMDAVSQAGFQPANFTDTSGNPSASKVYAAARIILQQDDVVGYFGSGSGVASQEQFWSAYGLAKAFNELNLDIPAVIRLGGNSEDRAVEILEDACKSLPAKVRGFRKDDTPAACAQTFESLVKENNNAAWETRSRIVPGFVGESYSFPINFAGSPGAAVWIDHDNCTPEITKTIVENSHGVLKEQDGKPVLAIDTEEAAKRDSELIACEIECLRAGCPLIFVDLPIPGVDVPALQLAGDAA